MTDKIKFRLLFLAGILFCFPWDNSCSADQYLAGRISEKEVSILFKGDSLFGSLLYPAEQKGKVAALIISGSGPTDRDGNQVNLQNNSLKLIAEALADAGIASLRYDKRMIAKSKSHLTENDLRFETYVEDAVRWIEYLLHEKKFKKIVVIGHSEGSLIGMLASQKSPVHAFVSLAGSGLPAADIIRDQLVTLPESLKEKTFSGLDSLVNGYTITDYSPMLEMLFRKSVQPYLISWFRYDPSVEIVRLKIPVLLLQGTSDSQVPPNHAEILKQHCPHAELEFIVDMNHVLKQTDDTPSSRLAAYTNPELPLAPGLADRLVDFLRKHFISVLPH